MWRPVSNRPNPASWKLAATSKGSEHRHAQQRPADEVVEDVVGRRYDGAGAGVAEVSFDGEVSAEGGAAASAHGQVGNLEDRLGRRRLAFQERQHGVRPGVLEAADHNESTWNEGGVAVNRCGH